MGVFLGVVVASLFWYLIYRSTIEDHRFWLKHALRENQQTCKLLRLTMRGGLAVEKQRVVLDQARGVSKMLRNLLD